MLRSILDPERPLGYRLVILVGCVLVFAVYLRAGRKIVRERYAPEMGRFSSFWRLVKLDLPRTGRRAVLIGWSLQIGSVLFLILGVLYCFFPHSLRDPG